MIYRGLDSYKRMQESLEVITDLGSRIHEMNRDIEGMVAARDALRIPYNKARLEFYTSIGKEVPNA